MSPQTIRIVIYVALFVAIGSAMPDRASYEFPKQIGLYLFDWFYRTVKIISFNVAKELEKKYPNLSMDLQTGSVVNQKTVEVTTAQGVSK